MTLLALLAPWRTDPRAAAIVCDFDGTLAPIVTDPAAARPAPGVVELLHRLAGRFGCVAVLSGRPAAFLAARLELATHGPALRAVGLYGLEEADSAGGVRSAPGVEAWRPTVTEAVRRAEADLPPEVDVEGKGLSVTLHWRRGAAYAGAAAAFAAELAAELGLQLRPARMSVELVPPLPVDKGHAVRRLCEGAAAALYLGDDVGDVPALEALAELHASAGTDVLRVAVGSDEMPAELAAAADLVVDGVAGAVELLQALDEPDADVGDWRRRFGRGHPL